MASTTGWSGEERGLFLLLLGVQWSCGCVPSSPELVRKSVAYSSKPFRRLWPKVRTKFVPRGNDLINERLEEHRARVLELQGRNVQRASRAANTRWADLHASSNAPSNPQALLQAQSQNAQSMSGDHAIQSNLKNKTLRHPVDSGDNSDASQRDRVRLERPVATNFRSGQEAWVLLIASSGSIRDAKAQYAIDHVPGGWPTIQMRRPETEPTVRAQFIAAYEDAPSIERQEKT